MINLKKKTISLRRILNQDDSSNDTTEEETEIPSSKFKLNIEKTISTKKTNKTM